MTINGFVSAIEKIGKNSKASEDFKTLFGVTPDQALLLQDRLNIAVLDTIIDNTATGKSEKFVEHKDLGIVNVDEKEAWKKLFLKTIGKKLDPKASILCGCVGYGNEIEALIELYGPKVVSQITVNDNISLFTNRLKRMYNIKVIEGDFLDIMDKFDYVTINSPYKQGLYRKHRDKGLELAKKKLIQIAPNDLENKVSKKYEENAEICKAGKLQNLINLHEYFNLETAAPICGHEFDLTKKTYNKKLFDITPTPEEIVYNKIQQMCQTLGTLNEFTGGVQTKNEVNTIVSVQKKSGALIEKLNKKGVKILENAKDYFYLNKFFGDKDDDPVGTALDNVEAYYKENVYVIDHSKIYSLKQFKNIFRSEPMRFVILMCKGFQRKTVGYSFSRLPLVDPKTKDVYKALVLNENDKKIIRNYINARRSNQSSS